MRKTNALLEIGSYVFFIIGFVILIHTTFVKYFGAFFGGDQAYLFSGDKAYLIESHLYVIVLLLASVVIKKLIKE